MCGNRQGSAVLVSPQSGRQQVLLDLYSAHSQQVCYLQAVWALGNIAGDSHQCRDMVLATGALMPLLEQLKDSSKLSMQRNATWTLSNFCRGKPAPAFEQVTSLLLMACSNLPTTVAHLQFGIRHQRQLCNFYCCY